jgi:hypothetical protein
MAVLLSNQIEYRKRKMKKELLLTAGIIVAGINVIAKPYPADVMRWSEADKVKQRKSGAEILKKIYAAVKSKKPSINIPKGVYRFAKTRNPWQPTHIYLREVKNFTIQGNGSWFYFDRQASAFLLARCDNVTIKNINIDYDPLPYVQGQIVSIDDKGRPRSFIFKPEPGYKMPEFLVKKEYSWRKKLGNGSSRILLFNRKTGLIKTDQPGMDITHGNNSVKKLDNGNYKVDTWIWWGRSLKEAGFRVGGAVALWKRAGRVIRLEVCGKIILDNVDIYASGFVAYVGYLGQGPFIFRNCDLKRRPGTTRLIAGNADGFNVRGIYKGATIENCSVEAIGDDCINLQGVYYKVFKQEAPTELIVARTPENDGNKPVWHFIAGDPRKDPNRPKLTQLKTWGYLGKRKVLQKTLTHYTIPKDRKIHKWAAASRYKPGKKYPAMKVKLDKPVKVDSNSIFWTENAIVKGSVIRNNVFHNNLARGIRLQTIDCVVENNKISYTTGPALTLAGQPGYWGESTNCQNVVIKNNIFKDSGRCGGNAAIIMKVEGDPEKAQPITNILFENNKIINPRGSGIELAGCENVKIIGNTITGLKSRPYRKNYNPSHYIEMKDYGVAIVKGKGLKKVVVKNNTIK